MISHATSSPKMAAKGGGNVIDGLKSVVSDIAGLTMLPDSTAHMQFLNQLQQAIQHYVVQKMQQATGMAQQQMAGAAGIGGGGPGGPQSPGGMGVPPPAATNGGAMGGGNPGFNTSSPDELRRVLSANGQVS